MRIIHKHYAQVLIGYDRISEFSTNFEEEWSSRRQEREQQYQLKLEEYQRQEEQWRQNKQVIEQRYDQAYQSWFVSEAPTRARYDRELAQWRQRRDRALQESQVRVDAAQAIQRRYLTWMILSGLASLLVIPAPLTLPAAIVLLVFYLKTRGETGRLEHHHNQILAMPDPPFRPQTPPPPKPVLPAASVPPKKVDLRNPPSMVDLWWATIATAPPNLQNPERKTEGSIGEALLVEQLGYSLGDDFITLPGVMAERKTDADVIVVGKNGVWVLDSKYYAGLVRYTPRDGWQHFKERYQVGGRGEREYYEKEDKDLGEEWQRERDSVVKTLDMRMHKAHPPVVGGLAFTYNARLEIHDSPVTSASAAEWSRQIVSIPCDQSFFERDLVQCAHLILNHSHRLIEDNTASALDLANALRDEYSKKLEAAFAQPF